MATCAGVDEAAGYVSTDSCATLKCVNDVWETDPATVLPEGVGWAVVIGAKHASQPPPHSSYPHAAARPAHLGLGPSHMPLPAPTGRGNRCCPRCAAAPALPAPRPFRL